MNRSAGRKARPIEMPATIASFSDGGLYTLPIETLPTEETTFTCLVALDSVVVKLPTIAGEEDFRHYLIDEEQALDSVRRIEPPEQRRHLADGLVTFPELRPLAELSDNIAHFAVVHKIQHERLRAGGVRVPPTRFGAVETTDGLRAAIFQQRVQGTVLLNMFDPERHEVRTEYKVRLTSIVRQLTDLLQSPLRNHINWYIRNFVVDPSFDFFTYVDCKPSVMFAAEGNRQNIRGLKRRFGVQDRQPTSFLGRLFNKLGLDL